MHLPALPGPRDLTRLAERATDFLDELVGLVPRAAALLTGAEALLAEAEALLIRVGEMIDRVDETRAAADAVVAGAAGSTAAAVVLVDEARAPIRRIAGLLDGLEPSLVRLQPTLERLAKTTDPDEVEAVVRLVDRLPEVTERIEGVLPVVASMQTVAPDIRRLLEIVGELDELILHLPGMGRIRRRVEEEQEDDD